MLIFIIVIASSTIGLIGYFTSNELMFHLGGIISFLDLLRYSIASTINKQKQIEYKIRRNTEYYDVENLETSSTNSSYQIDELIKSEKQKDLLQYVVGMIVLLLILFIIFSWEGFVWIGIVGGYGYFIQIIQFLLSRKRD